MSTDSDKKCLKSFKFDSSRLKFYPATVFLKFCNLLKGRSYLSQRLSPVVEHLLIGYRA